MWTKSPFAGSEVELRIEKWEEFRPNKEPWAGNLLWPNLNLEMDATRNLENLVVKIQGATWDNRNDWFVPFTIHILLCTINGFPKTGNEIGRRDFGHTEIRKERCRVRVRHFVTNVARKKRIEYSRASKLPIKARIYMEIRRQRIPRFLFVRIFICSLFLARTARGSREPWKRLFLSKESDGLRTSGFWYDAIWFFVVRSAV